MSKKSKAKTLDCVTEAMQVRNNALMWLEYALGDECKKAIGFSRKDCIAIAHSLIQGDTGGKGSFSFKNCMELTKRHSDFISLKMDILYPYPTIEELLSDD